MLDELCERPLIEKTRNKIAFAGLTWEIDEFFGENAGWWWRRWNRPTRQAFEAPGWLEEGMTGDPRYFKYNLIRRPYTAW